MPDTEPATGPVALITGASGLLGREILFAFESRGWSVVGTGLSRTSRAVDQAEASTHDGDSARHQLVRLDLADEGSIVAVLDKVKPAVVVHSAATRSPDAVAADPRAGLAVNAGATGQLVRHATDRGAFVLFVSTDYVFPGTLPIPARFRARRAQAEPQAEPQAEHHQPDHGSPPGYTHSDPPRPINGYGLTKVQAERELDAACARKTTPVGAPAAVALRVPLLYGHTADSADPSRDGMHGLVDDIRAHAERAAAAARAARQQQQQQQQQDGTGTAASPVALLADDTSVRYPTWTGDVARVAVDVAERYTGISAAADRAGRTAAAPVATAAADWPTRLHFSAQQPLTRYDMAATFAGLLGLEDAVAAGGSPPPFVIRPDYSVAPEVELKLARFTGADVPPEEDVMRSTIRPVHTRLDTAGLAELGISTAAVNFEDWWRRELKAYRRK